MTRAVALVLTALTGFSGLVYEVAWQKVLATLLGSHSEATASVLAIFLGGLSLGYWIFGRLTRRLVSRGEESGTPPRLLVVYGIVEASIGAYVFVFPWLFSAIQALSLALPHGSAGLGFAIDVALSALLIGPASVAMGGTIPILTQALSRNLEDATRFHALVYALNTAGAFAGALAAGFYLVPALGLVNVMRAMATINLVAGAIFVAIGWRRTQVVSLEVESDGTASSAPADGMKRLRTLSAVALLTGFSMMAMQTVVIRIGALSFGASQFTFSMVVAVFVLCIALGSLAVSALSRIPAWIVTVNQWALAGLFLALYLVIETAPYYVYLLRTLFRDIDAAFGPYHLASFMLVLAVIGPPVVLSGAALPLLFHHLRQSVGHLGDLAGTLYSWNTVGSLLGALLGGYALLYWLDLDHVYRLALASLVGAAALLSAVVHGRRAIALGCGIALLAGVAVLPGWSPSLLTLGLFREREPNPIDWDPGLASRNIRRERRPNHALYAGIDSFLEQRPDLRAVDVIFHDDDPTSTITVERNEVPGVGTSLSIVTNGKNDSNTSIDYGTTALAALVPALLADEATTAFVVGWGTGITTGELAQLDSIQKVDVAEISPGVIGAAPLFDQHNHAALHDPKVSIIHSDAYRALMRSDASYDLIVSEPSNPWVLGVELVYAREFLEAARAKLTPGGVFAQWIHTYEIDDATLELVLRTYASVFDHIVIWVANAGDLMLLGLDSPANASDVFRLEERASQPDFTAGLRRAGVDSFEALIAHEVWPLGVAHALPSNGPVHTLLHPRLNDMSGRAFFRGAWGHLPFSGFGEAARVGADASLVRGHALRFGGQLPDAKRIALIEETCETQGPRCLSLLAQWHAEAPRSSGYLTTRDRLLDRMPSANPEDIERLARLFEASGPAPRGAVDPETARAITESFERSYSHAAPMQADRLLDMWSSCREERRSEVACRDEVLASGAADDPAFDVELAVQQCVGPGRVGPQCRVGRAAAELLLERGETLAPWEFDRRIEAEIEQAAARR